MDIKDSLTPLTKGQLSIWFLDQLNIHSTHYNISAVINIGPSEGKVYQKITAKNLQTPFINTTCLSDLGIRQQLND